MMALDSALKLQCTDTANESLQCVDSGSFRYDSLIDMMSMYVAVVIGGMTSMCVAVVIGGTTSKMM